MSDQTNPTPAADESPALPEFSAPSDMPEFRSFAHELPSSRFVMKARMMELVQSMPEEWRNGDDKVEIDPADIDIAVLTDMVVEAEKFALDMAKDRTEMTEWLISQESGETAVFQAMAAAMEALGK